MDVTFPQMNTHQDFSKSWISKAVGLYGIESFEHVALKGGTESFAFLVTSSQHNYVLSVLKSENSAAAEASARYLHSLNSSELRVPSVFKGGDGQHTQICDGKIVFLSSYIDGISVNQLTLEQVYRVGVELGKLHSFKADCYISPTLRHPISKLSSADVDDLQFRKWLQSGFDEFSYICELNYPQVCTHGDVWPDNVIFVDEQPCLIDWFDGSLDSPLLDVGMALLGLCCHPTLNTHAVAKFLSGYYLAGGHEMDLNHVRDSVLYLTTLVALGRYKKSKESHPPDALRPYEAMQETYCSIINDW